MCALLQKCTPSACRLTLLQSCVADKACFLNRDWSAIATVPAAVSACLVSVICGQYQGASTGLPNAVLMLTLKCLSLRHIGPNSNIGITSRMHVYHRHTHEAVP